MAILIGCCGFPCAQAEYYRRFPLVEIQQTFYQPPRPRTLDRWRAEAPDTFTFTLKAWQLVTHPAGSPTWRRLREQPERPGEAGLFQPTATVRHAWDRSLDAAHRLRAPLLVLQCPPRLRPTPANIDRMRTFLSIAPREGLTLVWEPRGPWPDATVAELCAELDLVHGVDPFQRPPVTGGPAYFRLHGRADYQYQYSDAELDRLAQWCTRYQKTYCLFNNSAMLEDALRFQSRIGGGPPPAPPAPLS